MNLAPFPWERALAIGLGVLRLSPEQFWRMTQREFAAALRGLYGDPVPPLDRAAFDALAARFPDTLATNTGAARSGKFRCRHSRLRQEIRDVPHEVRECGELPRLPASAGERFPRCLCGSGRARPRRKAGAMTMREQILAEARTWIGTPYRHQASLRGVGCDCLGLVRGVWRVLYTSEPEATPAYAPDWAEASGEERLAAAARRHLIEIAPADAETGDVLLFRWRPHLPAKHAAILSAPDRMIHAYDGAAVARGPLRAVLAAADRLRLPFFRGEIGLQGQRSRSIEDGPHLGDNSRSLPEIFLTY